MRERETVKVGGEGCDHVVTEMYGMIALLKQKGQNFQSHMQHSEVFSPLFPLIFTLKQEDSGLNLASVEGNQETRYFEYLELLLHLL